MLLGACLHVCILGVRLSVPALLLLSFLCLVSVGGGAGSVSAIVGGPVVSQFGGGIRSVCYPT